MCVFLCLQGYRIHTKPSFFLHQDCPYMEKLDSLLAYTNSVVSKAEANAKAAKKDQGREVSKTTKKVLEGPRDEALRTRILEEEEVSSIPRVFVYLAV